jgi:anaerobic ribonucleoside-triphosphate reductase activating protein
MNYGKINKHDIANGPGVRVSLFVSGCEHHCKGCFNSVAWDFYYGKVFTAKTFGRILKLLDDDHITGFTVLGGEPLHPRNQHMVTTICRLVKEKYPNKDIWIYTGYDYDEVKDHAIMNFIDVLVDGPFIEDLKDISLKFRGSSNQRIIDVKESKSSGAVVSKEV